MSVYSRMTIFRRKIHKHLVVPDRTAHMVFLIGLEQQFDTALKAICKFLKKGNSKSKLPVCQYIAQIIQWCFSLKYLNSMSFRVIRSYFTNLLRLDTLQRVWQQRRGFRLDHPAPHKGAYSNRSIVSSTNTACSKTLWELYFVKELM